MLFFLLNGIGPAEGILALAPLNAREGIVELLSYLTDLAFVYGIFLIGHHLSTSRAGGKRKNAYYSDQKRGCLFESFHIIHCLFRFFL